MNIRTFDTQQLIDWGVHHMEWENCEHVVNWEITGTHDYEVVATLVFRAPDDGKLYGFTYEYNEGYNDMTGISYDPYVAEVKSFDATEVRAVTKLVEVTTYEPVESSTDA